MNHSFYSADRATHLKILVIGVAAAMLVSVVGLSARMTSGEGISMQASGSAVIKADKPMVWTSNADSTIR
ncbi:MAG: hypothetical protein EPO23_12905 [Xanthobacteraceae bacterium]|nr:MAG: hypothetical protein EPO23_12905 [Xanthobacteraceae bacterium]